MSSEEPGCGPFKTSQQAYDTLHIGDPGAAQRLQAGQADKDGDAEGAPAEAE